MVGELGRIETCAPAVAFHDGGYTVPGPRLVADQLRGRLAAALEFASTGGVAKGIEQEAAGGACLTDTNPSGRRMLRAARGC